MKRTAFQIILVLFFQAVHAQVKLPFDSNHQNITYRTVIKTPGKSKSAVYQSSLDWFAHHYDSQRAIIERNDSIQGQFYSTCNFADSFKFIETGIYFALLKTTVTYNLSIQVYPGKCSITISGLHYKYYIPGPSGANSADTGIWVASSFENQYHQALTTMSNTPKRKNSWMSFFKSCDKRIKAILASYKKQMLMAGSNAAAI